MLPTIAWRNIWRQKTRSLVVIFAVGLGIWALVFLMAFSYGVNVTFINTAIQNQHSHIQLHHPDFKTDKEVKYVMQNGKQTLEEIAKLESVQAATGRLISAAMASTANGAGGVQIWGIFPEEESKVTRLNSKLIEGKYFEGTKRNPILMSKKLAEKLKAKIRSKIILTFQDVDGEITTAAFRVVGLFDTGNSMFDEANIYVKADDLRNLLHTGDDELHEIAIYLNDPNYVDETLQQLKEAKPGILIEGWKEIAPELQLMETQLEQSMIIIMVIILLALIFGIINTMLMAVLERVRELGMLMAVGMNKVRVFFMIMLETIMLSLAGAPVGMFLGFITVRILNKTGIDLSAFSEGLREFGISEILRPYLTPDYYVLLAIMVVATAIIASIFPAWKAIRLKPVEAIRKI